MQDQELERLLAGCQQNDPKAQKRIYESFYAYGITVALYYSNSRTEAEEIVQDSFLKLFRHLERTPIQGAFRPWLRRIVINTAIDYYRRQQSSWKIFTLTRQGNKSAFNQGEERLDRADLYRLLQKLPPAYRLVFNLHVLEGYNHPEIARELGISVGTSKSNLSKARRRLQQLAGPFFSLDNQVSNA